MKALLTGNEAVAIGAYEAGVFAATGYPGTPATEIIETIARYKEVYTEWSVNEKTALEIASGFSLSGRRTLVVMKHVGLNVASDPLISLAYTGVNAGLVIVAADDPGMWSSQNEQDSRLYGRIANIPVIEPSDSEEAYIFTKRAFEISENFDLPVLLRLTRAISHTNTVVNIENKRQEYYRQYFINPAKNVLLPPFTSKRRLSLQKRIEEFRQYIPQTGLNRVEIIEDKAGIITSGITYQYVKDALPVASVLKLGIVHPLNHQEIKKFNSMVKELFVIEESEPFIEDAVRALGMRVRGKQDGIFPWAGELNQSIVREAFNGIYSTSGEICEESYSTLCAGCPYLGMFYVLSKKPLFIGGDIGCYTLSVRTFPHILDTTLCMGSGISQAAGYSIAKKERAAAVIGDSTFFHSGIQAILNAIYHKANILVIILDNHTTSMTGGQPHIGTGKGLREAKKKLLIEDVLRGCGVEYIRRVGAYDIKDIENEVNKGLSMDGVTAIIVDGECIINKKKGGMFYIDKSKCSLCGECLSLGCEAIVKTEDSCIIRNICNGCGLCIQICENEAIKKIHNCNLCR
ncbi:MAG: thiamine pyrophosphate-dependent enzyme [Nitrospirota bacterium]